MENIIQSDKKNFKTKLNSWCDLLKEITERKARGQDVALLSDKACESSYFNAKKKSVYIKKLRAYGLGAKYDNVCFTRREAECMIFLLKGKTNCDIANTLNISSNSVQECIKHMKSKTGCCSNSELINLVNSSEFMKNVDFQ